MAEHNLDYQQPTTHTNNTHWRQLCCCQNYHLTHEELIEFYEYYNEANIMFEGQNQRWDLIKELHSLYFEGPTSVSGKQFLKLGFQGQYPETDFRGGGVLGLKLILQFTQKNINLVRKMENDSANFFFAITAINIAFFMRKYFHLADYLIAEKDQQQYCNRRALKNFCRIIISQRNTYQSMHEIFLQYFYTKLWMPASQKNKNLLLQFNSLFKLLTQAIRNTFQNHSLQDFHEFLNTWKQQSKTNNK